MCAVASSAVTVEPARRLRGRLRVPGDKSISHRYAMLAALANGTSTIADYSSGIDCQSTLSCLEALGVIISATGEPDRPGYSVSVTGHGLGSLHAPDGPIDTGNSGTTMRLMAGVLSGHPFEVVLTGDHSLRRRPMQRVINPLKQMGARLDAKDGHPPLTIRGSELIGIDYVSPVASAQVKSAVLLAGLHATGITRVHEAAPTRDHTERALSAFGAEVSHTDGVFGITGGSSLHPIDVAVPGDPSSAAFWATAAAALPDSDVTIDGVGLNPTRTAYLDILRRAGADVEVSVEGVGGGEPYGTIRVRSRALAHIAITAVEVPSLIDELPVLGALAAHGGVVDVSGADELRHKESDRITAFANGLRALGVDVEEREDGFRAVRTSALEGGTADAIGDHRLAMAFTIAALGCDQSSTIKDASSVDVSYPGFFAALDSLRQ